MSFRILDPFQVYTDLTGNLAAGGTLHFYTAGTTTDADVFGDSALTVNNGPTITIGTDGRAEDDIWGDATKSYRCRVYAADGTLIRDRDNLSAPGAGATTIPTLQAGEFLTSDGTVLSWEAIRQVLDPAGATNKILGSDGTSLLWVDKPADGGGGTNGTNANVTVTGTSVKWNNGTGDLFYIQCGTGSAPATGGHNASASVTFPTAFKNTPKVFLSPTSSTVASASYLPVYAITGQTTTGFNVAFDSNSSDGGNGNFVAAIPFDWVAFGVLSGT